MTSIFVAKLDFNTTEDQLRSIFEEHGRVNRITIAKDRETGKPRGFAFVEMINEDEADAAIAALDNYTINGRQIAVKKADDRATNNKPSGERRPDNRPARTDFSKERENNRSSDLSSEYKKLDDFKPSRPVIANPDEIILPKVERNKKEKESRNMKDAPKKTKMEAYKKSGKANRFFDDDDDDDWDDYMLNRNRSNGWDDDEDEDDDY